MAVGCGKRVCRVPLDGRPGAETGGGTAVLRVGPCLAPRRTRSPPGAQTLSLSVPVPVPVPVPVSVPVS
eukprot:3771077-Rhodomonas_salina.1